MLGLLTAVVLARTVTNVAPDLVPTFCAAQAVAYLTPVQIVHREGSTQVEYAVLRVTRVFKGGLKVGSCVAEALPSHYEVGHEYFQMFGPPHWPVKWPKQPVPVPPTADCPGGEELPVFGSTLGTAGEVKDGEVIFDYVPVQFPMVVVPMSVWEERAAANDWEGGLHVDERALLDFIENLTPQDCTPAKPAP